MCVVGYVGAVGYMGGSCGLCVTVDGGCAEREVEIKLEARLSQARMAP